MCTWPAAWRRRALVFFSALILAASPSAYGCQDDQASEDTTVGEISKEKESGDDSVQANEGHLPLHSGHQEEVTVTAQRRKQALLRVPGTVTVVNEAELRRSSISSTRELQRRAPALVVSTNSVLGQPYIRGVGTDLVSVGSDPSVATYVDGVYQTRAASSIVDLFDVARIEVLKGPQGTLYGRNSTGGAISIVANEPVPELGAETRLTLGAFKEAQIQGFVNVPLSKDKAEMRISFLRAVHDGYMENIFDGTDLANRDTRAIRGQVRIRPGAGRVELLLEANAASTGDRRNLGYAIDPDQPSPAVDVFGGTIPDDPRQVLFDAPSNEETDREGVRARVVWDAPGFEMTSLTAYRQADFALALDLDATEIDFAFNNPAIETSRALSQELQFVSNSPGRFQWIAGAFGLREDADQSLDVNLSLAGFRNEATANVQTTAWAIFAESRVMLSRRFSTTVGLRYSDESKRLRLDQLINGSVPADQDDRDSWSAWTPRFALEFLTSRTTTYFTATRGFKSGGFNANQIQPSFAPEYLWSYEAGFRASVAEGRFLAGASAFHYDYTDVQVNQLAPIPGAFPTIVNAAEAEIQGVEAELAYSAISGFRARLGLAHVDARFTEFVSVDANDPSADPDRAGNRMPRAPVWSGNATLGYHWSLPRALRMGVHAGYAYQAEVYFDPYENPAVRQGPVGLWDGSVRLEDTQRGWYCEAYGANLTDELYAQNIVSDNNLIGTWRFWGAPRTAGVRFGYVY